MSRGEGEDVERSHHHGCIVAEAEHFDDITVLRPGDGISKGSFPGPLPDYHESYVGPLGRRDLGGFEKNFVGLLRTKIGDDSDDRQLRGAFAEKACSHLVSMIAKNADRLYGNAVVDDGRRLMELG